MLRIMTPGLKNCLTEARLMKGMKISRPFFTAIGTRFNPGRVLLFGFSEAGDLKLIDSLIDANNFKNGPCTATIDRVTTE